MTETNGPTRPAFWRSLDEYENSPQYREAVEAEFPTAAELRDDVPSRRAFLQRMGASLALAGLATGCAKQPEETIVPFVQTPEHVVPGQPRMFATSMPVPGGAIGLLVQNRDGRPIKVEGNPKHPASLGAAGIFEQASLLDLYDPDRSQIVRRKERISNWPKFLAALKSRVDRHRRRKGEGLCLLTGNSTSPTLLQQIDELSTAMPGVRWYEFEPFPRENVTSGAKQAFGRPLSPVYHVGKADVIFSLDADFLMDGPARLRLAREFGKRRRVPASGRANMTRLYVAESTTTITGANADHRLPLAPRDLPRVLASLAGKLGMEVAGSNKQPPSGAEKWISVLADDLKSAGKRSLVLAGPSQPPEVHALAIAINARLKNVGETVTFIKPVDRPGKRSAESIAELARRMRKGEVESLFVLDCNPAHSAPGDLEFASLMGKVPFSAHLGLYRDETAVACGWHVPATHYLESWSDARAEDGTAGIVQPLIAPLYGGISPHQVLNALLGRPQQSAYDTVRGFWKQRFGTANFDRRWNQSLHDGVVEGTAAKPVDVRLAEGYRPSLPKPAADNAGTLPVVVRPDPSIGDGRFANNGWLQELPKPFIKLTWGNAAYVSPETAKTQGLRDGSVVRLDANGRTIDIPVLLVPGQPKDVVTLHAGYGRTHAGRNGNGRGVNVAPLQTASSIWSGVAEMTAGGEHVELPLTQHHFVMENPLLKERHLVRAGTIHEVEQSSGPPSFMKTVQHHDPRPPTLYPDLLEGSPQWGMTINLGTCIGCNACVVACQAENNIPVVGPEQVAVGREMHWIRVDTYFSGEPENPRTHHQPVPCMHCEHAPCEPVCPVAATTHSKEGLNEMTYNRCIGTRYCSNNCPYKVRRFNFFDYRQELKETPVLQLLQNPEVTVRSRGVMEKCTYCVQRISAARIQAKMEDREIRDGEVVTACQAACPTEAIVFGNIADKNSAVSKNKSHPLNYGILTHLNTRPRTTYLASVRNPNPRLTSDL
jgi:molybdopterin-containing oxidoreductase family iron-sulfur binding subunit